MEDALKVVVLGEQEDGGGGGGRKALGIKDLDKGLDWGTFMEDTKLGGC